MIRLTTFAAALSVVTAPLAARDWAGAIAFAQAPEQSSGVGVAATIGAAIDAAVAECVAGGALAEDCYVTSACEPAGWSADFFVQHEEGPHWHETFCGLADEQMTVALEATICSREIRPYLIECALVQVYDESGQPKMEW